MAHHSIELFKRIKAIFKKFLNFGVYDLYKFEIINLMNRLKRSTESFYTNKVSNVNSLL